MARSLVGAPATRALVVTPSDTADLPSPARALYIGEAGNISVILQDDVASVLFIGVLAGTILPISVRRVRQSSTSARNIVALL